LPTTTSPLLFKEKAAVALSSRLSKRKEMTGKASSCRTHHACAGVRLLYAFDSSSTIFVHCFRESARNNYEGKKMIFFFFSTSKTKKNNPLRFRFNTLQIWINNKQTFDLVSERRVDSSFLIFSLSSHRYSYISLLFSPRFIDS
jgi:hypothetical protein